VEKNRFFCDFLENGVEFWHASLQRSGALLNGCKNLGDFLETFLQEGAIFFRGLFKGSLNLYYRSYGGATYAIRYMEGGRIAV